MFVDPMRAAAFEQLRQHDLRPFARLLTLDLLLQAAARCSLKVVASPLNVLTLVWLALAAARRPDDDFATLLDATAQTRQDQEGCARDRQQRATRRSSRRSPHDPRASAVDRVSEEAFVKARRRLPQAFWLTLLLLLADRFQQQHGDRLRYRRFRLLALDGTRLTLPDWPALRQTFGTANNAHGRHGAQARLVLLHFPLARLPYRYELVPLAQGEPTVARRLVGVLQADDLLLLDAGFCSYGLLWDIQGRQAFFVLRQPRELNFRTLRTLGPGDRLVRWTPKDSRGQWRKEGLPKSIDLRQLVYRRRGYRPRRLLSNVLDAQALPWAEVSRLVQDERTGLCWCAGIYHQRWQIETSLRELKVVQQLEGSLRSRREAGIRYEVGGHLVWYLLVRWLLVEAAVAHGAEVLALSYPAALTEIREMSRSMLVASGHWLQQTLVPRLLERLARHRVSVRPGRKYPRTKKKHPKTQKKTKKG
jgi:Transposase DDE domain